MRGSYRAPGVNVRWQDVPVATGTSPARMDITGFAGIAQRGPIGTPVKLGSWSDFIGVFGDVIPEGYLGYAVRGFFENGGRTCWVVRVADRATAFEAGTYLLNADGKPIAHLFAASPGSWGAGVEVSLAHRGARQFDLSVNLGGEIYENWSNLSLDPKDRNFIERVLGAPDADLFQPGAGSRLIRARVWYPHNAPTTLLSPSGLLDRIRGGTLSPRRTTRLQGGTDGLHPSAIIQGRATRGYYVDAAGGLAKLGAEGGPLHALSVLEVRPLGSDGTGKAGRVLSVTISPAPPPAPEGGFHLSVTWRDTQGNNQSRAIGQSDAHPDGRTLSIDPLDRNYVINALAEDALLAAMVRIRDLKPWPGRGLQLKPGDYLVQPGLTIADFVADADAGDTDDPDRKRARPALEQLSEIWEIGLLALPDLMPKARQALPKVAPDCARITSGTEVSGDTDLRGFPPDFSLAEIRSAQQAMLRHCLANRYCFAILDPPPPHEGFDAWRRSDAGTSDRAIPSEVADAIAWRLGFGGPAAQFGALYFPWIAVASGALERMASRLMPPSGHVAGLFARTDTGTGVHRAPANAILDGARATALEMPEAVQGLLNARDVNVIKPMANRGVLVYGARTLVRSDADDAAYWRFVNVRRLVSMVEKSVDVSTQWTVFEPNDRRLWQALDRIARSLLSGLWRRGMLDGATAEDAYFVRCDEATNPPEQIDRGEVVTEIGLRPPWPAEFVTLRLVRTAAETNAIDSGEQAA